MQLTRALCVFLLVYLLSGALQVSAEELRILGPNGLTRAVKDIQSSATVEVELSSTANEKLDVSIALTNEASQLKVEGSGDGRKFSFNEVAPGTWKLSMQPGNIVSRVIVRE